jgi:hypothetical protein
MEVSAADDFVAGPERDLRSHGVRDLSGVTTMRRSISDAMMTIGGVTLLALGVFALDGRVREEVAQRLSSPPSAAFSNVSYRMQDMAHIVAAVAREQTGLHAPLLIFALVGGVLMVFMIRT